MTTLRELGESAVESVLSRAGRGVGRVQERKPLAHDLLESDDDYLVVFDAPGATMSDVSVRYQDDRLRVRLERFRDYHEGFDMRFPGRGLSLSADVELPGPVEAGDASATLARNGTLRVRIPKADVGETVEIVEEDDGESLDAGGDDDDDDGDDTE